MKEYIDKSVLVAEIERLKKEDGNPYFPSETADKYYARGVHFTCDGLVNFLDTLEVKENDLVEELDYNDYIAFFKEHPEYNNGDWGFEEMWTFGQYCYKLGIKAWKGE